MKLQSSRLCAALLPLAFSMIVTAQERLETKQLAGPAEEIQTGVMAQTDPSLSAIHSKSALIPVDMRVNKRGDWSWRGDLTFDGTRARVMVFSGGDTWNMELLAPNAKRAVPAAELVTEFRQTTLGMGSEAYQGDLYVFDEIPAGEWQLSLKSFAPLNRKGYVLVSTDSPYRLMSYQQNRDQLVGNAISFVSYGFEKSREEGAAVVNAGIVTESWLRVTNPDGDVQYYTMYDDGMHNDDLAGDGIFGGSFPAELVGNYNAQVIARGVTPEGRPFLRTAEHPVPVIAPDLALARDYAVTRIADDKRLTVEIAVDSAPEALDKYRVFAEVWGTDLNGEMIASNWIGGMAYVEDGQLELALDARWLTRAGVTAPFELRNLRIENPDNFIPLATADSMILHVPGMPRGSREIAKTISDEMLMGPKPQRRAKAGPVLMLVHGYCSGNAWGPQQGQFANSVVFQDFNKNRSHDQFANLIGSFGSSYSSFGVVAHSQGGAASTHLYTYYWSGLDYASGSRLIQSLGTPYQGTSLAGNVAALGDIFGVGCGANNDLTYSGASSWLSGIPTWARNAVNYYTTSFTDKWWRYDYCHLASDLILSDPDDGTTEKSKGQLSSAINRGHKTGQCHTTGMRDMAQYKDGGRNSTMSSNAAR
ncbi:MAG: conditioned medium factor [Acidobacteriota bacterium]|nr:conditioned medium factor [Acidobacteriota bacterium]